MGNYKEIYISTDVEANGPIPGDYSLTSIGASAAGALTTDNTYELFDHTNPQHVFYSELTPISENFIPEAINVGLLEGFNQNTPDPDGSRHYEWTKKHGIPPLQVMTSFADWCKVISQKYNAPVTFMAYPASFDWTFVYWYFVHTGVTSPFGFSRVLDLKSVFAAKTGKPITKSTKRNMPKHLFSKLPHTHRADDDAIEQGILGINLLNWKPSA